MNRHTVASVVGLTLWLAVGASASAADAGPFTLKEAPPGSRIESVDVRVHVSGTATFAIEKGQVLAQPISADATLKFRERWLPGAGRDADALRSLRHYEELVSDIRVADHATSIAEDVIYMAEGEIPRHSVKRAVAEAMGLRGPAMPPQGGR